MTGSPLLEVVHAGADLLDPAGIFVAHDVGQMNLRLLGPDAFDDVQVGSADAGAADADDDVGIVLELGLGDILPGDEIGSGEFGVVAMKNGGFHDWLGGKNGNDVCPKRMIVAL